MSNHNKRIDHIIYECPICLDSYNKPCKLIDCGHAYCSSCFRRLLRLGVSKCPVCRGILGDYVFDNVRFERYLKREQIEEASNMYDRHDVPQDMSVNITGDHLSSTFIMIMFLIFVARIYNIPLLISHLLLA